MSSQATKASITLPKALSAELRKLAKREHRTLSGVIQEAARYYVRIKQWEGFQRDLGGKAAALGIHTEDDLDEFLRR